ncbi:MAG: SDR family NAD(P)-dependent oxidoreductase [Sphingomonadaceae bacterium]
MSRVVVGQGGIGRALADALPGALRWSRPDVDPTDEASIARAAATLDRVDLAIVTTGMLHDTEQRPERALKELDPAMLARSFAINAIAPAIVAKHLIPKFPRDDRAVFAVLGARVGSIGDNRTGGWHGYRASKAALVMLVKSIAIEVARTRPHAIVVTLHPGTVDTALSKPFQANVAPEKLFTPAHAAERLLAVIAALTPADSGGHFAWDGTRIPD